MQTILGCKYHRWMSNQDLGALLARATRRVLSEEEPLLAAHHLSMWAYIVLSRLAASPAETQLSLAREIGYDKSRLIGLLDRLEDDDLIVRTPDPADRRAKIVTLTASGRKRYADARRAIRKMERRLLTDADGAAHLRELLALLAPD
jgi:DNA-binding MarR family transcriptional regulator